MENGRKVIAMGEYVDTLGVIYFGESKVSIKYR